MKTSRFVAVQDPAGIWKYGQMLGALVHIKSRSIQSGFFSFDADSTYKVEKIGFRMSQTGVAFTIVKLEGLSQEFVWKDLEIIGLSYFIYPAAICGTFCCGQTLCGRFTDADTKDVLETDSECPCCSVINNCNCEGIVLD